MTIQRHQLYIGFVSAALSLSFSSQSIAQSSIHTPRTSTPHIFNGTTNIQGHIGLEKYLSDRHLDKRRKRIGDGSETASHYYRVGVSQYEKGNLENAERAFQSVLRANGLNKQAYYYLARIGEKQGDAEKMAINAREFHNLVNN